MYKKLLILLILILMLLNSGIVFGGALNGLLLWFNTIVPTLFPFMIISYLLQNVYEDACSKPVLYCILLGISCGTPLGAFVITNMYSQQKINKQTAYVLLTACNISSPAFVISYISKHCLGNDSINPALLFTIYFPAAFILILYAAYTKYIHSKLHINAGNGTLSIASVSTSNLIDYIVTSSCTNIIKLGAYIIISSIFAEFIKAFTQINYHIRGLLIGLFEITSGINYLCQNTYDISSHSLIIAIILFVNAFGGLSFILQANLFIKDTDLSLIKYAFFKLMFACFTLAVYLFVLVTGYN
jgi:hypothetical protein